MVEDDGKVLSEGEIMKASEVLAKLCERPAPAVQKVLTWSLKKGEDFWAERTKTALAAGEMDAYNAAFDNWHAIKQMRLGIAKVHLVGGRSLSVRDAA